MSPRNRAIGLSVMLGFALLAAVPARADEKQPGYVVADGKRVLTGLESLQIDQAGVAREARVKAEREPPADRAGRDQVEKAREPRVLVRDLRDSRGGPYSCDSRYRCDSRRWRRWTYRPGGSLYSPYGPYYGYDPYPTRRGLMEVYRARRYIEQQERDRRFNRRDMAERKKRLLDQHEEALLAGLRRLKEGQPARATVALTLAAKLNQGDPACRIHLAQARLAQGHYLEAGLALRRALQLQPKLVYADLHLQEYYETEDALDEHTDALAEWVRENRARPEVHFLLGFLEFQRGDFGAAYAAFERVKKAMPEDELTRDYLEITKPATARVLRQS